MSPTERAEYDAAVAFASKGALVFPLLQSGTRALVFEQISRAVELRGGFADLNRHRRWEIARDVMAEVAERGYRHFATELEPRLLPLLGHEGVVKLEERLSEMLQRELRTIDERFSLDKS
jgi:hypothetical protein